MSRGEPQSQDTTDDTSCAKCGRERKYCVCDFVTPVTTRTKVVILQHPQEPGVDIGTVPVVRALFPNSIVRTGLSWPNLTRVLGHESSPQKWGVLYLGSVQVEGLPEGRSLVAVDKKGVPLQNQSEVLKNLEGVIVLDGTWSQAKTLWWRNAWLLKLKRLVLRPSYKSLYDQIRREPRRGCLSTLETVGEVLSVLEHNESIRTAVTQPLQELVSRLSKKPAQTSRHRRGRSSRY